MHSSLLLLIEPLAVNAYDRINGYMRLKVNDNRSYDMEAEIVVGNMEDLTVSDRVVNRTRRRGTWALHQQTYWYGQEMTSSENFQPELIGLYEADVAEA